MRNVTQRFCIWSLLLLGLVLLFLAAPDRSLSIQTNILTLLPTTEQDRVIDHSLSLFSERLAQKTFFLVTAPDRRRARQAANIFSRMLTESRLFSEVAFRVEKESWNDFVALYFPYRFHLLSATSRAKLLENNGKSLSQKALLSLYNPFVGAQSEMLAEDPFLLFADFLHELPQPIGKLVLDDGLLCMDAQDTYRVFLSAQLRESPYSINLQHRLMTLLDAYMHDVGIHYQAQLIKSGVVFHANAGTRSAWSEISMIGTGSLLGIIVLMIWIYRSLWPFVLALLAIAFGILAAWLACIYLFGGIHILTIVFGATLIGVSIDYGFHYFTERYFSLVDSAPLVVLDRVLPGLLAGLITSVIAYLGLAIAPFPGLRQIAVFSAVGLVGAFLTVWLVYPLLARGTPPKPRSLFGLKRYLIAWRTRKIPLWLTGVAIIAVIVGLSRLTANDDIRLMQSLSPTVLAEEKEISNLLGQHTTTQFILVEGSTPEQVLQRQEALSPALRNLVHEHKLASYWLLSDYIPSKQRQKENYKLQQARLMAPLLKGYMSRIGMDDSQVQAFKKVFTEGETSLLTFDQWRHSPISSPWRFLWLGQTERGYAAVVTLGGVTRKALVRLGALERPEALALVDRVADISALFKRYREWAFLLLCGSFSAIYLLWSWRYGVAQALRVVSPPSLAMILTMAILGYLGEVFTLFNVLALILVLGIGIDYTLFFMERKGREEVVLLAISLSALTTCLSFGLLSLSQTAAIHAFGITVLIGIGLAFLFAPLVLKS